MIEKNKAAAVLAHLDTCCNAYKGYFVPLFKVNCRGEPYHAGTGFGLQFCGTKYLITARHVLDKDQDNECDAVNQIFCISNGALKQIDRFNTIEVVTSDFRKGQREKVDIVVMEPLSFSLDTVFEGFFTKNDIDLSILSTDKYVAACGFPSSKNKLRSNTNVLTQILYGYCGKSSSEEKCEKAGFESPVYSCFDILLKKIFTATKKEIKAPKPHGISGGPVLVTYDFSAPETLLKPMLCGVVIENVPHLQCIAYARIELVLEAIVKNRSSGVQSETDA